MNLTSNVSPQLFPFQYEHNGHIVSLHENNEAICQGGPLVSTLKIDGNRIGNDAVFGGPILFHKNWVLAPKLIRKFLKGHGFKLLAIELTSHKVISLVPFETMILLSEIRNGEVLYFTDLENTEVKRFSLNQEIQ